MENYLKIAICVFMLTIYFIFGWWVGREQGQYQGSLQEVRKEVLELQNRVWPEPLPDSVIMDALPQNYILE